MIPASLLLILVAVTLLVLGLTGGSSSLLISSIGASLLAAVALVVGARQAAGVRRAGEIPEPAPDFAAAPEPAYAAESPYAESPYAEPVHAEPPYADEPEFVAEAAFAAAAGHGRRPEAGATDDFLADDDAFAGDSASSRQRDTVQFAPAGVDGQGDLSADEARAAGRRDAEAGLAAAAPRVTEPDQAGAAAPDYDRAASAINAARTATPGEDAWRRDPGAATAFGEPDEFDEPDADDPDDEPLPQSVRPADAVRVARMDAEVLVVDGRPRYHVPECTHLVGRLTEPIPANEAVELGFSPCGLCRPVDRLVAAAARTAG